MKPRANNPPAATSLLVALPLALVLLVLDQLTKLAVLSSFSLHEVRPVLPGFFNLTYVRNTGAAWGLFSGMNLALALLALLISVLLVLFRSRIFPPSRLSTPALGLLLGGILGNFFDRVRYDFVVDFLDFHFRSSHFPAFNVADSAICVGVALFCLASFLSSRREKLPSQPPDGLPLSKRP